MPSTSFRALAVPMVFAIATALLPHAAAAGGPEIVTFPSGDCPTTVQACITSLLPGSTILLAESRPAEIVTIGKSLTLRSAPSFRASLEGVIVAASSGSLDITVKDIDFSSIVDVRVQGGTGHHVALRHISNHTTSRHGLALDAEFPATLEVVNSTFVTTADEASGISLLAEHDSGLVSVRLVGDRVDLHTNPGGQSGIHWETQGDGDGRLDVLNTVVRGAGRDLGESSLDVFVGGTGITDVNIAGATFDRSKGPGVGVGDRLDPPGQVRVALFDTIVSNAKGPAIFLDALHPATLVYRGGSNDVFASGAPHLGGRSAGAGNLKLDPRYVDGASGDLRLRASSPLIDRGVVCSPAGVANLDAAGHARLSGPTVDIGAYEHGAGKATGEAVVGDAGSNVLVGTDGADILCGMGGGDVLFGGDGGDYLDGGTGPDVLFGDAGPDRLFGRDGDDDLCTKDGVGGNDRADGGKGSDGAKFDAGDSRVSIEHGARCIPN